MFNEATALPYNHNRRQNKRRQNIRKEDGHLTEKTTRPFRDVRLGDSFPLAMAYVRRQELDKIYEPELAIVRGTLYPELDKPFMGKTVTGGCKR